MVSIALCWAANACSQLLVRAMLLTKGTACPLHTARKLFRQAALPHGSFLLIPALNPLTVLR